VVVDWWEIFQPKWWDVEIGLRSGIIGTFQERYGFLKGIKTLNTPPATYNFFQG
jgi:hypothetical protein